MTTPIRILMVEDNASDAKLIAHELRKTGLRFEYERVQDETGMRAALAAQSWDLILSDWGMPRFNALKALRAAKEACPEAPFIIVSGTIGEEAAVQAMRAGASDYVPKERLAPRLNAVVERELRERDQRIVHMYTRDVLQRTETRMARLQEAGIVGIAVVELEGKRVVESNEAFCRMLGYELLPAATLEWTTFSADETDPALVECLFQHLRTQGTLPLHEERWRGAGGATLSVLVGLAMLDGDYAIAFVADVTEQRKVEDALRRTEAQLQRAQKMEAVGNLAGGVAHDFNNLLTVILGQVELLEEDVAGSESVAKGIEQIRLAANRASALTRQLLAFGRRQVMRPRVVTVESVLRGVEPMLATLLGEDVDFSIATHQSTGYILADPAQLEHVIINLVINARDAMPDGGQLTIEAVDVDVELGSEGACEGPDVDPGSYVMLAITDTGVGMDAQTQARVFEPFFSTKDASHGTGLGLAMAFGIVRQSHGHISVDSEPGVGTRFKLHFPRVPEPVPGASDTPLGGRAAAPVGGCETILVVEDQDAVRSILQTTLTRAGYVVLTAHDAASAMRVAERYPEAIDLLCTDVIMPGMNGRALAAQLTAARPGIKVLFVSGYPGAAAARHGLADDPDAVLSKPVSPRVLLRRVRRVLDARDTDNDAG